MNFVIEKVNEINQIAKNVEAPKPTREAFLAVDKESEFGVEDKRYEPGMVSGYNIFYDDKMRIKAASLIKIVEWITSHTPLPEHKDVHQESPEEYETRK